MRGAAAAVAAGLLLAAAPAAAAAPQWSVDAADSRLGFVTSLAGEPVTGRFRSFRADIRFAREALETSRIEIVIDMASVTTGNAERDATIRSPSLFAVESFPEAHFVADDIARRGAAAYLARGELTIRETTKEIALPFTLEVSPHPERADALLARAEGEVTIERLAYGVGQGDWRDTSWVPNEVTIRFDLRAWRPRE